MKAGEFDRAQTFFEQAMRAFTDVSNEPLRLAALYNLAHLARERGDSAAAVPLYESVLAAALTLGHVDVHAGALAGLGLAELALGARASATARMEAADALLRDRPSWWFQGAEQLVALRVLLALADASRGGRPSPAAVESAVGVLEEGLAEAQARDDGYAAAWLAAECAPALRPEAAGQAGQRVAAMVEKFVVPARARGYVPLLTRFARAGGQPRMA
jgi:tetratricopeptide (TPR) repeat protein